MCLPDCHAHNNTTLPRHGTRSHSKNHSNGKRLKLPRLFCLPPLFSCFVSRSQFTFQLCLPPFSLCYPQTPAPLRTAPPWRLFALRYQRISELRHEAPPEISIRRLQLGKVPPPLTCHICTACPEFIMAYSERYVGHTSALPQEVWQQFMGCS